MGTYICSCMLNVIVAMSYIHTVSFHCSKACAVAIRLASVHQASKHCCCDQAGYAVDALVYYAMILAQVL